MAYSSKFTESVLNGTYKFSLENETKDTKPAKKYTSKYVEDVLAGKVSTSFEEFAKMHNIDLSPFKEKAPSITEDKVVDSLDNNNIFNNNTNSIFGDDIINKLENSIMNPQPNMDETEDIPRFPKRGGNLITDGPYLVTDMNGNTQIPDLARGDVVYQPTKSGFVAGAENAAILFTRGFTKAAEGTLDWMNDVTYNKIYAPFYRLIGRDDLAERESRLANEFIQEDLTGQLLEGADEKLAENSKYQSLITPDSVLGQVAEGGGGLAYDILVGKLLGVGSVSTTATNATRAQKFATFALNNLPTMTTVGTRSYGSAYETALNEGATPEQATAYAILASSKEMATEWIMGGVPGTNGKGIMDVALSKTGLETMKDGIKKTLIEYGFDVLGEGFEEGLSEVLEPVIKNMTYTDGETIDMEAVFQSVIVGAILGGMGESPKVAGAVDAEFAKMEAERVAKIEAEEKKIAEAQKKLSEELRKYYEENPIINPLKETTPVEQKKETTAVEQKKKTTPTRKENLETKRAAAVEKLNEVDSNDKAQVDKIVDTIDAIDKEIAKEEKIEAIKNGTDKKVEQTEKVKQTEKKVEQPEKKVAEKKVTEKKVETTKAPVVEEKVETKQDTGKEKFVNELNKQVETKKELPENVTAMYDKLSPKDKNIADKLIELQQAYKENPKDGKVAAQLKEYRGMESKEVKQYLFERNKAMIDFKKVDKDVVEQQTQKAFEEPPTYRTELSDTDTTEPNVSNLDSMSKNDLFYNATQAYESLLQSGLPGFREKALQYYKEYKDAGGKKSIATLDEMLAETESPSVEEEKAVVAEPKTIEEYHKSKPNSHLEDAYGGKKRVAEYSIEPVDDFNGKLRDDVTLDELNDGMVKLVTYNPDGSRNEYTYENKKQLLNDVQKAYGGWRQLGDGPKTIMSTQGEFYLERDKFVKGGWKWVDANGDMIKGQESADIGQRHRKMMEEKVAEAEKTGEVPEVTAEILEETPLENPNIAEEVEDDVLEARIVGGELVSTDKQLSRFSEKFKNTIKEEGLLSPEDIAEIDKMYLYEVAHNKTSMDNAKEVVKKNGFAKTKENFIFNSEKGDLTLENYALGHELLQEAVHNNDTKSINEILPYLTMQATKAGQIVQLTKLYHKLSGEQLLLTLQKKIDIMKKNKVKGAENMVLTDEMVDKILKAGNDHNALTEIMGEIEYELGTKLKGTVTDKINAIRFYSMLDNVTTHVNNITNNAVNGVGYKGIKDGIGAVIESAVRKFAPDTFKDTVRSENEAYVTIQDKQRLKESRKEMANLDKKIEKNNYADSLELRKSKEKIINKLKGEVKMKAIHDEVLSIYKEIETISNAEKTGSEIRIEDGQQSDNQISMQNKINELIKIKDRLEAKLPKSRSTKTLRRVSKDVKEFVVKYLERNQGALKNRSKTKSSMDIESAKSIFGKNAIDPQVEAMIEAKDYKGAINRIVENLKPTGDKHKFTQYVANVFETKMNLNSFLLQYEDLLFKNLAFKTSFGKAAMVNGLDAKIQEIKNSPEYQNLSEDAKADYMYSKLCSENGDVLSDIYDYAVNEAFEATAQQENLLARAVDHFKNIKNDSNARFVEKLISFAIDAQNPFTRTLFNTAENAFMYSPNSLITTTVDAAIKARKGQLNPTEFINNISKGLTGTAVRIAGYILSSRGILTEEEDDEPYGLRFGDIILSIDKLDMAAINLFAGARLRELSDKEDIDGEDAIWSYIKPFVDMTFLSTYTDTMTDFKYGGPIEMVGDMAINFIMQHFPQGGSKINKIFDTKERNLYPDNDEDFKYAKRLGYQILNRVPLLYNLLPEKMNNWGETKMRQGSIIVRAVDELIWPGKIITGIEDSLPELTALQEATGASGLAPSKFSGNIEYKNQKYEATPEEKRTYQQTYGNNALEAITEFTNSKAYKNLTNEQRVKTIKTIYDGARELAKQEFFDNRGEEYETSAAWINEISSEGISMAEYATFKGKINTANSNVKFSSTAQAVKDFKGTDLQKAYLYSEVYATTESAKKTNIAVAKSGISFDAYLDFKSRTRNLKGDGTKRNVLREINNTKGLSKNQKLLLTYLAGYAINNGDYSGITKDGARQTVFNYVNGLKLSASEKRDILEKAGYTILKNGNIDW